LAVARAEELGAVVMLLKAIVKIIKANIKYFIVMEKFAANV